MSSASGANLGSTPTMGRVLGGFSTCSRIAGSESLVGTGIASDEDAFAGEVGGVGAGDDWCSARFLRNALRTEPASENDTFGGLGSGITIEASVGVSTALLQLSPAFSSCSFSISANERPWCVGWVVCARRRAVPTLEELTVLDAGVASSDCSIWARRCVTTDKTPRLAIDGLLERE